MNLFVCDKTFSTFRFKWRKCLTSKTKIRHWLKRHIQMGLKLNIIVFIVTIVVTLSTTALMCLCVVTDYWEIVSYPLSNIHKILNQSSTKETEQSPGYNANKNPSVESLYGEKVIFIKEENVTKQIMIQMHAGLWSICYDVSGIKSYGYAFNSCISLINTT